MMDVGCVTKSLDEDEEGFCKRFGVWGKKDKRKVVCQCATYGLGTNLLEPLSVNQVLLIVPPPNSAL